MSGELDQFLEWTDSYLNFEKTPKKNIFWLKTMEFLCQNLGNPQNSCEAFHVAGSKGKGSVSTMLASILKEQGIRTGLYSSPHITDFRERISLGGMFFKKEVYLNSFAELKTLVESIPTKDFPEERPLTWFELVTALGMLCFKNAQCEAAVYEVGLGGRLDATNIITPKICLITPIELEHTEFLGDTLEKIAGEKAGIIKSGIPVVVQKQKNKSVRKVFEDVAKEKKSPVYFVEELVKISREKYLLDQNSQVVMTGKIKSKLFSRPLNLQTRLLGKMQLENAALAAIAAKISHPEISEETIERGIFNAMLPGRFEIVRNISGFPSIPFAVLDGAHTVKSVDFTLKTFNTCQKLYGQKKAVLLFACAKDKDVHQMAKLFRGKFCDVLITKPGNVKETDLEKVDRSFTEAGIPHTVIENYDEASYLALKIADEKKACLLMTGSFYLVSEVKKYF